jgi:hypothetical protein
MRRAVRRSLDARARRRIAGCPVPPTDPRSGPARAPGRRIPDSSRQTAEGRSPAKRRAAGAVHGPHTRRVSDGREPKGGAKVEIGPPTPSSVTGLRFVVLDTECLPLFFNFFLEISDLLGDLSPVLAEKAASGGRMRGPRGRRRPRIIGREWYFRLVHHLVSFRGVLMMGVDGGRSRFPSGPVVA